MALTLKRRRGDRLLIGEDVVVEVKAYKHGGFRLAIHAPREIRILRWELLTAAEVRALQEKGVVPA